MQKLPAVQKQLRFEGRPAAYGDDLVAAGAAQLKHAVACDLEAGVFRLRLIDIEPALIGQHPPRGVGDRQMPAFDICRTAEIEVLRPDGDIAGEHGRFLKTGAAGKDSFDAGLRRQRHFAVRRQSGRDLRIGVKSDGIAAFKRHRTVRRKTSAAYFKFFTGRDNYVRRFRFHVCNHDIGE